MGTLEDCVELYNTTFEMNGNQLTLENKHIIMNENTTVEVEQFKKIEETNSIRGSGREEKCNDELVDVELGINCSDIVDDTEDDDQSIYLSLESVRNSKALNSDGRTDISSTTNLNETFSGTTRSLQLDHNCNTSCNNICKEQQRISGTCVICFDTYEVGDMIVWSQD